MIKIGKKLLIAGLSVSLLLASGGIASSAHASTTQNQNAQQIQRTVNQYHGNVPKWKQVGTAGYTLALQQHNQQVRAQQARETQQAQASKSVKKPVVQANNTQNQPVANKFASSDNQETKSLPQTNEASSHTGVIASALVALASFFGIEALRKRN